MLVALMIDDEIGRCERDWFNRTVVGLLSTGLRVIRILPDTQPDDPRVALTPHFTYRAKGLPWTVNQSIRQLADAVQSHVPDVIHAIGPGSWRSAMALSAILDSPVAISLWSRDDVRGAQRLASSENLGAILPAGEVLAKECARSMPSELIQVVPIGVYVAPEPHRILAQLEFSVAVVLAARGAPYGAVECIIDGLSMVAPDYRQVTVFADLDEAVKAKAWKRAGEKNVREQFSLIPDVLEHRELVLSASVLVLPAATGRNNSFLLQAMAAPMATIATRDPHIDVLRNDDAATIVERVEPAAWATALRRLLSDPQAARSRAESARRIVAERHSMTAQSELLTATYERMLTGGNVTLPA